MNTEQQQQQQQQPMQIWDPFCGSGSIVIETFRQRLLGAIQQPLERQFDFERWRTSRSDAYAQFKRQLQQTSAERLQQQQQQQQPVAFGTDLSRRSIDNARFNWQQVCRQWQALESVDRQQLPRQLNDAVQFAVGDFDAVHSSTTGSNTILCNLPYGHRLQNDRLRSTFSRFGQFLERRQDLTNVWVLNGSREFESATRGLRWSTKLRFQNRGIPVQLLKLIR
jgi:23S rRNA G2445 N2-methylase RlmL